MTPLSQMPDDVFSEDIDGEGGDPKYEEAKRLIIESGKASTSLLQRKLGIGYGRAAKIVDRLEEEGIVGAADGSKAREVLVGREGM
jgi:S-DNA-T family DNA segregation ATPase FtsK/SpoIIIE